MQIQERRQRLGGFVGMAVIASAGLLFAAGTSWAAEAPNPAKAPKASKSAKSAATVSAGKGEKMLSGGTIRVESTKASGASIVTKSKACVGETPKIARVQPDEGRSGDKVTITGTNFGAPGCLTTVSFGPGTEAKFTQVSDSTVTATVPAVSKKGMKLLTLTAAAGGDSRPFLVK